MHNSILADVGLKAVLRLFKAHPNNHNPFIQSKPKSKQRQERILDDRCYGQFKQPLWAKGIGLFDVVAGFQFESPGRLADFGCLSDPDTDRYGPGVAAAVRMPVIAENGRSGDLPAIAQPNGVKVLGRGKTGVGRLCVVQVPLMKDERTRQTPFSDDSQSRLRA